MNERILIISHDVVGKQMAGPGIRYYHLARVLAKEFEVILAVPEDQRPDLPQVDFQVEHYKRKDWTSINTLIDRAAAVIFPSDIASDFPQLAKVQTPLVI